MDEKFKFEDLSGMVDKEFLLIVLGAEHERMRVEREIRRGEYTQEDYDSPGQADGVLSEVIGRHEGFCEYRQLARIRNLTDGKGIKFSDSINKSIEYYIFKIDIIRLATDDAAFLRGTAQRYDYLSNTLMDEKPARFEAYWPFPSQDSVTMKYQSF